MLPKARHDDFAEKKNVGNLGLTPAGPRDLLWYHQLKQEHRCLLDLIANQIRDRDQEIDKLKGHMSALELRLESSNKAIDDLREKEERSVVERRQGFNDEKELLKKIVGVETSHNELKRKVECLEDADSQSSTQSAGLEQRIQQARQQQSERVMAARDYSDLKKRVRTLELAQEKTSRVLVNHQSPTHKLPLSVPGTTTDDGNVGKKSTTGQKMTCEDSSGTEEEEYWSSEERVELARKRRAQREAMKAQGSGEDK